MSTLFWAYFALGDKLILFFFDFMHIFLIFCIDILKKYMYLFSRAVWRGSSVG